MQRNLLDDIYEYLNTRFPGRENYAKGVALAITSTLTANSLKVHDAVPIKTKSNLYVLLCGVTNSGKTSMINYGMDILNHISYKHVISDDITPETLPKYLANNTHSLMRIEEMSGLLGSYKRKGYMAGLREMLVKAFDGAILSQSRSTRESTEAKNYALAAIADIQPEVMAQSADAIDVHSGFLPRFVWFHELGMNHTSPKVLNDYQMTQRDSLIRRCHELYNIATRNKIHVLFTQDEVDEIYNIQLTTELYDFQGFYDRVITFIYKLAMLHMFGSDAFAENMGVVPEDDWASEIAQTDRKDATNVVSELDVRWAIQFAKEYVENSLPQTINILKLNDGEKVRDLVARYIELNQKPIPESLIFRGLIHGMKDYNRIRTAIELARKMNYIAPKRVQGGTNYELIREGDRPVEDYATEEIEDDIDDSI